MDESKKLHQFLHAFQGKSKEQSCELIKSYNTNVELLQEIIDIIESNHASQMCERICEVLFDLNTLNQQDCTNFSLQFLPALIWAYYSLLAKNTKWSPSKVETLLLFIYNQIVHTNTETPFCNSYSIPTLSKSSIYHEPLIGIASTLTESALSQHEKADKPILIKGPTKFLDRIPAALRSVVIRCALREYNSYLSCYLLPSLNSFCHMVIRLSCCGFPSSSVNATSIFKALHGYPKIAFSGNMVKEMVMALHFAAFNGCTDIAVEAMRCLHKKACYSICAAAVMATNAAQDLIKLSTEAEENIFEFLPPVNPYKCSYRGVADLDSVQKRKLANLSVSLPKKPQPSETSSPRLPEAVPRPMETSSAAAGTSALVGFASLATMCLDIDKCFDKGNGNISSIEKTASKACDESSTLQNEIVTVKHESDAIHFAIPSDDKVDGASDSIENPGNSDSGNDNGDSDDDVISYTADPSFIELPNMQRPMPKIVIDIADVSDDTPLINSSCTSATIEDVYLGDTTCESDVALRCEVDCTVTVNGHICDTRL